MAVMMGEKDYSVEDSRDAFKKCIKHLVEKTDFDVMYEELNNTDIGKKRMPCVFILRGEGKSSREKSQELYDGIYKESDKDFVQWFNEIKRSLSRTANKNNGKHQEILELLQDSSQEHRLQLMPSSLSMSCKLPKEVTPLKRYRDIKVILLGCSGSGKTRFFRHAIGNPVEESQETPATIELCVDFTILDYQYQNIVVRLSLWDTAGQERFAAITQSYYRGSNGALVFVDLRDFKELHKREGIWLQTKDLIQDLHIKTGVKIPCLIIGTKYDLVEQLSNKERKAFAELADTCSGGNWICTSAKTGYNVQNALNLIVKLVMDDMAYQESIGYNADDGSIIRLSDNPQPHGNTFRQRVVQCFNRLCN